MAVQRASRSGRFQVIDLDFRWAVHGKMGADQECFRLWNLQAPWIQDRFPAKNKKPANSFSTVQAVTDFRTMIEIILFVNCKRMTKVNKPIQKWLLMVLLPAVMPWYGAYGGIVPAKEDIVFIVDNSISMQQVDGRIALPVSIGTSAKRASINVRISPMAQLGASPWPAPAHSRNSSGIPCV